jgi:hypothetical protein
MEADLRVFPNFGVFKFDQVLPQNNPSFHRDSTKPPLKKEAAGSAIKSRVKLCYNQSVFKNT